MRRPTMAWPASWYAVSVFSCSLIAIERRSVPIRILSRARSKCSMRTSLAFSRAANRAASLTRFGGSARDHHRLDIVGQRHAAHVHLEDLFASLDVGQTDHDLAIEAARAQQRGIEHVGPVGRSDH